MLYLTPHADLFLMKTKITKITDKKIVGKAVSVLEKGGLIVYPTETLYGLGADATNDKAVRKLLTIKKRNPSKKMSIAFRDIRMAKKYLIVTAKAANLAKAFMPGPLSLELETKSTPRRKAGLRIPDNKTILKIIRKLDRPITSTSANISGKENSYKIREIIRLFDGKVDMIIDAGNMPKRKASTVYDPSDGRIIREGPISRKQIDAALKS